MSTVAGTSSATLLEARLGALEAEVNLTIKANIASLVETQQRIIKMERIQHRQHFENMKLLQNQNKKLVEQNQILKKRIDIMEQKNAAQRIDSGMELDTMKRTICANGNSAAHLLVSMKREIAGIYRALKKVGWAADQEEEGSEKEGSEKDSDGSAVAEPQSGS